MSLKIVKEYQISMTDTASSAFDLDLGSFNSAPDTQINIIVEDSDAIIKFGPNNTVTADNTVTSEALVAGNFTIPAGGFGLYGLSEGDSFVSVISRTASETGTVIVQIGHGEKI